MLRDHYEIVSLGVAGFNPYRENEDGRERYIASEKNGKGNHSHAFKYAVDGVATNPVPDFVFDKPIDGAGTMVVNGNLIITDTFAYHGILIVLGDVRIVPTLKHDQIVYGKDGNPVHAKYFDKYGDSYDGEERPLFRWYSPSWVYQSNRDVPWTNQSLSTHTGSGLNIGFGFSVFDKNNKEIQVRPRTISEYRGELIVQGCLMVKGRIITEQVDNALIPGEKATGKLRLYWSREAVIETGSIWAKSKSFVNRISWAQDEEGVDVSSLWEDKLD